MLEFRILGPLEVVGDGEPVVLPRPKQQELLALLLLRRGEGVSADWLLEHLWAGAPPTTARASLQNYVSKLRRALGADVVVTHARGYLLAVEAEQTDVGRFERLVAEGRAAELVGERAARLREGLALWRGPALVGVSLDAFGEVETARLEELRVEVFEDAVEAELELGRSAELVSELEQLVAREPFRERLRAQLMLALYRSGRQAAALEVFQRGRATLREELGLEPSVALRELERAILTQDAALDRPQAAPLRLAQRRKLVTVVFADLVESTVLADELDPERFRQLLDRFFEVLRAALVRHGGTIEMFIGDAVMAVFGVPQAHEDDALRAVRAVVDVRSGLAALNEELVREDTAPLELRIGVNSGEVFVGDPSGGHALVTGSVVNQAKRVEEAARPGEIVLGAGTFRLVRGAVEAKAVKVPRLKQERPVAAFRLLALAEDAQAIARYFEAALVGRDDELDRIGSAYEQACATRRCRLLAIVGEPGVGKTRLAREFVATVGGSATVLIGHCVAYGEGATFLPLREMVNQIGDLAAALAGDAEREAVARRVAQVVGLARGASALEEGFWAVRRLLEVLARDRPLVLVFEDVHWAEPALLDLIEQLQERAHASILLLAVARPEFVEKRPTWSAASVSLGPLLHDQSELLLEALPRGRELGAETRVQILESAEGNPLFVEQLLAHFHETGGERFTTIPPPINSLLAARLDLLPEEERLVVERASIEGKTFRREAVVELAPDAIRARIGDYLSALVRKGLIQPERPIAEVEAFRFHHQLVREAAYESLPKAVRADLHERFANWLESCADEPSEIIGYHLERAVRSRQELGPLDGKGRELATRAGRELASAAFQARARGDHSAANDLLERAVALFPADSEKRVEFLAELGPRVDEAVRAARALGDSRLELRALVERASRALGTTSSAREADDAIATAEKAIRLFEEVGDEAGLAKAWRLLCHAYSHRGKASAAIDAALRQIEHARRLTDGYQAPIFDQLIEEHVVGRTPVPEALREAEQLLRDLRGDRHTEAEILVQCAELEAMLGRFDHARRRIALSSAISQDLYGSVPWFLAKCVAQVALLADDPVAAERGVREWPDHLRIWWAASPLAETLYRQGRLDEADHWVRVAQEETNEADVYSQITRRNIRAKLLARRGDFDAAHEFARDAVVLGEPTEWLNLRGDTQMDLAEVLGLAGEADDAVSAVERALDLYVEKGNVVSARKARALLPHPPTKSSVRRR